MALSMEPERDGEVSLPQPPQSPPVRPPNDAPREPWQMVHVDSFGHQVIPDDVLLPLLERLPGNVQATTCRLLCRALRAHFRSKLTVHLDTVGLRAARQQAQRHCLRVKHASETNATASSSSDRRTAGSGAGVVDVEQVDTSGGDAYTRDEGSSGDSSGSNRNSSLELWGGVPPHAVEWFLAHTPPSARAHMTLEQRCAVRDAILARHRASSAAHNSRQQNHAAGSAAAAAATVATGRHHTLTHDPEDATGDTAASTSRGHSTANPDAPPALVALTAQGALFWRLRPGTPGDADDGKAAEGSADEDEDADAALSPVPHYWGYTTARMLAAVPPPPPPHGGHRHGGGGAGDGGGAVGSTYRLSALRELTLAAVLHGDTDMLTLLAQVPGVDGVRHQLAADCAWWAVRGYAPIELLAWAVREPEGPLATWRSSDAPFLAAALSLRQRAVAGDEDGGDVEGPGATEELRRALGRLHAAGFGSFHAAGRTFLAAVDLAARGKVAVELVCWLLDCGCPTGPPGWSYVAAVRPLIDGAASAAASERCLDLAARLARRRVPLGPAALSGIAGLPYTGFCSYVSLVVGEYGCPVDRTALYGEALDADATAAADGRAEWLRGQGLAPPLLLRWRPLGVRALWPTCVLGERGAERGPPLWLALDCVPAKCGSGSTSAQFGVVSSVVTDRLVRTGARQPRRGNERNG